MFDQRHPSAHWRTAGNRDSRIHHPCPRIGTQAMCLGGVWVPQRQPHRIVHSARLINPLTMALVAVSSRRRDVSIKCCLTASICTYLRRCAATVPVGHTRVQAELTRLLMCASCLNLCRMESLVKSTDACCDTLATLVCTVANIPSFSLWLKVFLTVISLLVYALQVGLVYKLYWNGYKFDPDLISSFIREGFLDIPSNNEVTDKHSPPLPYTSSYRLRSPCRASELHEPQGPGRLLR